jgi:hypothetical protein
MVRPGGSDWTVTWTGKRVKLAASARGPFMVTEEGFAGPV